MPKVDPNRYGNRRPKLTLDDLEGGDYIVLTIAAFDEAVFDDEEGKRVTPFLEFQETGDKVLFLNATQVRYLVDGFGTDESDEWIGRPIPLEAQTVTFRGKRFEKLYIAPPERWDQLLAAAGYGGKQPKKPTAAKPKRR
ncbi:MAG: hypothetical protein K6T59_11565 [Bryobacteraceae bacterium]|nr:hypothetical protein [Bryobacteraceae bacterium]